MVLAWKPGDSTRPSERHLVERLGPKTLRGARHRLAAKPAVEAHRGFVVRQRPDHEAMQAALAEIAPRGRKQLAAEAKPLEFGPQIKLVDLAIIIEAARTI